MPDCVNKASLPPNLYRILSTIFSNLMDCAILCRASDRFEEKKPNFAGFLGADSPKNRGCCENLLGQT